MIELRCPGLRADWLNGWLAAVGAVVRSPALHLSWSEDRTPVAILHAKQDPLDVLTAAFPTAEDVLTLAIARDAESLGDSATKPMARSVPFDVFGQRARLSRTTSDPSLASTVTDLVDDEVAAHSPFDPPVPRGLTIHDRLARCIDDIAEERRSALTRSLGGTGARVSGNGLGFDYRRLPAAAEGGELRVDPVVEVLAFWGLHLFPTRGDGSRQRTRGWVGRPTQRRAFTWPAWRDPLPAAALDHLLDRWYTDGKRSWRYGVTAAYGSVPYQPQGSADTRRAYTSERLM